MSFRDQPGLEQALQLGIGAVELLHRSPEDGVRLLAAKEVELSAELKRDLTSPDRIVDQLPRSL